jgi:hypothetical protein
MPLKSGIQAL